MIGAILNALLPHWESLIYQQMGNQPRANISQNLPIPVKFAFFTWFCSAFQERGYSAKRMFPRPPSPWAMTNSWPSSAKSVCFAGLNITNCRTWRDANDESSAPRPCAFPQSASPLAPIYGYNGIHKGTASLNDWATLTAITAPRTAIGYIFLTTESDHPVTTTTSLRHVLAVSQKHTHLNISLSDSCVYKGDLI